MNRPRKLMPDAGALAAASLTDEAALQVRAVRAATDRGWRVYHTHDSRRSEPGFPDLVLCRPPRVLFVELKVGRRRLSDDQVAWLELLEQCDQVDAFVLRGRLDGLDDLSGWEHALDTRFPKED
jgi:hypothetical protein